MMRKKRTKQVGSKGKLIILSERNYRKNHHVSYDTVLGMENAFTREGVYLYSLSAFIKQINQVLKKLKLKPMPDFTIRCIKDDYYLFICMGICDLEMQISTLLKISEITHHVILYCFDTWEAQYKEWNQFFSMINPAYIFFAYKSSKEYFQNIYNNVYFLPQSMDEKFFYPRNLSKEHLFMQMGRKNMGIHKMILNYLQTHGLKDSDENYVYERIPGKIIYPQTNELAEHICKSQFFVCAPKLLEDFELTGEVSDVTARFYEAMACKSLIIGFKPKTYDELFPRGSMIELKNDENDFEEKITYFLNNPDVYKQLVNENYLYLISNHKWKNRLDVILSITGISLDNKQS